MLIDLSKEQIYHLIEVVESDLLATVNQNSISVGDFESEADQSVKDYVNTSKELLSHLGKLADL